MKTLARRQWRCSGVFIVNFKFISHFVRIVDSCQCVHIEKTNIFKDKTGHIMRYVLVF